MSTRKKRGRTCFRVLRLLGVAAVFCASYFLPLPGSVALAANGSAVYTYDALGRVSTITYDTGVIVIYTYDANGNRLTQIINVNTLPLCLGSTLHGNPIAWGAGLWSAAASGC